MSDDPLLRLPLDPPLVFKTEDPFQNLQCSPCRILRCVAIFLLTLTSAAAQTPTSQIPVPSDVAAPPANASKTKNGLASEVLKPGTGNARPGKDDVVSYRLQRVDERRARCSTAR